MSAHVRIYDCVKIRLESTIVSVIPVSGFNVIDVHVGFTYVTQTKGWTCTITKLYLYSINIKL